MNDLPLPVIAGAAIVLGLAALTMLLLVFNYGQLWFQAYWSKAHVSFASLLGMSLRKVNARTIVQARIMATQAGLGPDITPRRLEAHYLAGGDVPRVIRALIAAQRADLDLDFDRACAIDLAGRDVLDAVQTSVNPKVIDCPDATGGKPNLSAVAKNGVELKIRARVTVRTNLQQLIGGATEETIIARVGEGIITSIGSAETHFEVMEHPDKISKAVLQRGLDAQTAFQIVSIDIADIEVGENIGARLQADQAEADTRVARAKAEERPVPADEPDIGSRCARTATGRASGPMTPDNPPARECATWRSGTSASTRVPRSSVREWSASSTPPCASRPSASRSARCCRSWPTPSPATAPGCGTSPTTRSRSPPISTTCSRPTATSGGRAPDAATRRTFLAGNFFPSLWGPLFRGSIPGPCRPRSAP